MTAIARDKIIDRAKLLKDAYGQASEQAPENKISNQTNKNIVESVEFDLTLSIEEINYNFRILVCYDNEDDSTLKYIKTDKLISTYEITARGAYK